MIPSIAKTFTVLLSLVNFITVDSFESGSEVLPLPVLLVELLRF